MTAEGKGGCGNDHGRLFSQMFDFIKTMKKMPSGGQVFSEETGKDIYLLKEAGKQALTGKPLADIMKETMRQRNLRGFYVRRFYGRTLRVCGLQFAGLRNCLRIQEQNMSMNKIFYRCAAALFALLIIAFAGILLSKQNAGKVLSRGAEEAPCALIAPPLDDANGYEVNETNFPDAVFRAWILDPANLQGAGSDGYLTAEEIGKIDEITVRGQADALIRDLKGIELFTSLRKLSVPYNALVTLDLRANRMLDYVNCSYNLLEELYVSGLDRLNAFYCEFNYLETLDLSGNTALQVLYCRHNLLTELDLRSNTELVFIETFDNRLTEIDVSMLKKLEFLHIDHNRLTKLDMSGNPNLKGGGFVVRNNDIRELILPDIEGFTVYYDDFAEQDPISGYERLEWYADAAFTQPVTGDVYAEGQTLYGKRIPNDYTVSFSANGGSGAPASVAASYGIQAFLPQQLPVRTGYKFIGWSKDRSGSGESYAAGAPVLNLAGSKYNGEKVTLYALWEPISYTVRFDANASDASGEMDEVQAEYGNSRPLPPNAFSRDKYDFAGWALTPDGEVVLTDRQSVLNLADEEGAVVMLYAVWELTAEEVQRPFAEALDAETQTLSANRYFSEDWDNIVQIAASAKNSLAAAGKDEEEMRRILSSATEKMRSVLTEEGRAQEIVSVWEERYETQLGAVFSPPVPYGKGKETYALASEAAQNAAREKLTAYSSLSSEESRVQAAAQAESLLAQRAETLNAFLACGEWLSRAEEACALTFADVRSSHFSQYESLLAEYKNFSESEKRFVSDEALNEIFARLRLSQEKQFAAESLKAHYETFSREDYSEEKWQELADLYRRYVEEAESAGDHESLLLRVDEGIEKMNAVPDKEEESVLPEEPETPPEEPEEPSQDPQGPTENPDAETEPPADETLPSDPAQGLPRWAKILLIAAGCAAGAAVLVLAAVFLIGKIKKK